MTSNNECGPSKRLRYGDEKYEETLLKWAEEADSGESDIDSDDDYIPSNHDSESEMELEESMEQEIPRNFEVHNEEPNEASGRNYFYGKNRFKWSKEPPYARNTRTLEHNLVIKCPGLKKINTKKADPEEIWDLLFDDKVLTPIIQWSNVQMARMRSKYKNASTSDLRDLDMIELKSFLGLLLLTSIYKSNHENIRSIFATDGTGRDIFRCVTNSNRFATILLCLRFDDRETRLERKKQDPLAPISEIFNNFIENCRSVYTLGTGVCIDEMLVSFRGRSKFKMYMPAKPCKYGLKIMALTDSRTSYLYNAYIYCGKDSDGFGLSDQEIKYSKPTQAVIRLAKPIYDTNRNITADNWFSSIELVQLLKTKKITYVGTLRKNKSEIPAEFLPKSTRAVGSSLYGFTNDMTIISHVPKKNKAVVLISSMHHNVNIDNENGKPEIISYYNCNKGGVDSLDEKCSVYSSGRRTRRWPLAIFFRMLDISSVNSFILYQDNPQLERFDFVKRLAMMLVTPEMKQRFQNIRLSREVRLCIGRVLNIKEEHNTEDEKFESRKVCRRCPASKRRKTSHFCIMCKIPICMECTRRVCRDCAS